MTSITETFLKCPLLNISSVSTFSGSTFDLSYTCSPTPRWPGRDLQDAPKPVLSARMLSLTTQAVSYRLALALSSSLRNNPFSLVIDNKLPLLWHLGILRHPRGTEMVGEQLVSPVGKLHEWIGCGPTYYSGSEQPSVWSTQR